MIRPWSPESTGGAVMAAAASSPSAGLIVVDEPLHPPASSRSNLGFPFNGTKSGSTVSQPGVRW